CSRAGAINKAASRRSAADPAVRMASAPGGAVLYKSPERNPSTLSVYTIQKTGREVKKKTRKIRGRQQRPYEVLRRRARGYAPLRGWRSSAAKKSRYFVKLPIVFRRQIGYDRNEEEYPAKNCEVSLC
ncbi:MAG: hypothetical protein II436_05090, partial [Oscillospiraceae bacterium]|nr:hypothetical protein [Oscillospiraceae bacterium]